MFFYHFFFFHPIKLTIFTQLKKILIASFIVAGKQIALLDKTFLLKLKSFGFL